MKPISRAAAVVAFFCATAALAPAAAQEDAAIRKNLAAHVPQFQKIDEVRKTPMPGLYEVRTGTDLYYTDANGSFLIEGRLFDVQRKRDLTKERQDKLLAIDFDALPLKDAFVIVRGNGKRKLAVFEDPNCSYCKRFERDLQKVGDITIYLFLYPILGADSVQKSRNLWCAPDKAKAWQDWMVKDHASPAPDCDAAALARNVAFGKKYKITGTPTLLLHDGTRVPGAIGVPQLESLLAKAQP
nr:DsbC family protein [uncultured Albidiferax sp.]